MSCLLDGTHLSYTAETLLPALCIAWTLGSLESSGLKKPGHEIGKKRLKVILTLRSSKKPNFFAHNFAGTGLSNLGCIFRFVATVGSGFMSQS